MDNSLTTDAGNHPVRQPRIFYGYFIVVSVFFILLAFVGSYVSFGVFLKPVSETFGWSRGAVSAAAAMAWIMQGFAGIFMGRISDRYGPRITMAAGGLIFGIGFFLMSRISDLWQLYVIYILGVGVGVSGTYVVLTSTVARWFIAKRGLMTGLGISGSGVGIMVVPVIASQLIATYDWRTSYIIVGCFVLVIVVLLSMLLKRDPAKMGLEPYGSTQTAAMNEQKPESVLPAYGLGEALRTRQFWMIALVLFILGYCVNVIQVHIVPHASDLGIPETSAASLLSIIGGTGIAGPILVGMLADKTGNRKTFLLIFLCIIVSFVWLLPSKYLWQFIVFAIPFGFISNGGVAMQAPLAAELFGTRSLGAIIGVLSVGFCVGSATGAYIPGFIYDATNSYQVAFILSGALGIVSSIALVLLKPVNAVKLTNTIR
jgi:MFS family permease